MDELEPARVEKQPPRLMPVVVLLGVLLLISVATNIWSLRKFLPSNTADVIVSPPATPDPTPLTHLNNDQAIQEGERQYFISDVLPQSATLSAQLDPSTIDHAETIAVTGNLYNVNHVCTTGDCQTWFIEAKVNNLYHRYLITPAYETELDANVWPECGLTKISSTDIYLAPSKHNQVVLAEYACDESSVISIFQLKDGTKFKLTAGQAVSKNKVSITKDGSALGIFLGLEGKTSSSMMVKYGSDNPSDSFTQGLTGIGIFDLKTGNLEFFKDFYDPNTQNWVGD